MTQGIDPQRLAAETKQPNLLVIAPPGCGKTELLALRACELIPRLAPHQRILALTFTNRAKANLGDRLRRHLGRERFRRYVAVHNFHGFAADVVLAHGRTIGLAVEDLKLPTTKTLRKALAAASTDTATRDAASQMLAKVKRAPLSDEEVLAALSGPGHELARAVELDRILANELHYEDLLRHAERLLNIDEVANLYRRHFGGVLVDEFQDLSPQQLAIALETCVTSRTFVGDPLQGIYSWAGAEPAQVEAQLREICGEPVPLTVSYRSSPNVLTMLNGVSGRLGGAPLEAADPNAWPDGGASSVLRLPTKSDEATFIAAVSSQIVKADPTASVGVIARAGWRRREIDQAFAGIADVPCRHWDLAIEDPGILERIRVGVAGMPKTIPFDHALEQIIATVDRSDVDTIEQIEDAFMQLQAVGATDIRSALQRFRVRADDAPVEPGVHLLNAHTGKGQQFDWVFLPGLEEGHLPGRRSTQGPALAEEERVLLVMLSRAKHGVVATYAQTLDGKFGPYASTPCRWLSGLAASATMNWPQLEAHLNEHYPHDRRSA